MATGTTTAVLASTVASTVSEGGVLLAIAGLLMVAALRALIQRQQRQTRANEPRQLEQRWRYDAVKRLIDKVSVVLSAMLLLLLLPPP